MHLDPWTFLLQIGNFLILMWILRRWVWRPVLDLMTRRQAALEEQRAEAEKAHAEAQAWATTYADRMAQIAAERERLLDEARQSAASERHRLLERAHLDCQNLLKEAREEIAHERTEADLALRREAGEVAVDIATRLLALAGEIDVDGALFARALHSIRELPQGKRLELGGAVRVVSSRPPRDELDWRERLADAVGAPLDPTFETDPALIGGVELHFRRTSLRFSWRDGLQSALEELISDDHAAASA